MNKTTNHRANLTEARRIAKAFLEELATNPDAELDLSGVSAEVEAIFDVATENCLEHQASIGAPTEADVCAYLDYFSMEMDDPC